LGSASIAQVHRAVLLDGREVAVKVQRPSEEPKLRGDIANLKAITKTFRESLPVDYYTVFCELEKALANELDFLVEAQSMQKIASSISHTCDGKSAKPPLIIPAPIQGLCTDRVLIMDFINGVPLNKLADKMKDKQVEEGSPEAILFANKLLTALTEAFARMIFGPGFIHGDPHPGNIFITEDGDISLIDCGQVKQIPSIQKKRIAELVLYVDEYSTLSKEVYGNGQMTENNYQDEVRAMFQGNDDNTFSSHLDARGKVIKESSSNRTSSTDKGQEIKEEKEETAIFKRKKKRLEQVEEAISDKVKDFGVTFEDGVVYKDAAVAVAILLFAEKGIILPGGYSGEELSPKSPLRVISSFPQELVMLGRATVLCKGIASRLQVKWNIASKFAPSAKQCIQLMDEKQGNVLPIYARDNSTNDNQRQRQRQNQSSSDRIQKGNASGQIEDSIERNRVKFYEVKTLFYEWMMGKIFSKSPQRVKRYLLKREAKKIEKAESE
jgi:predicted unusual protein kinase regulating ubiquinone biosynthesis (AarF/ABC1/UbiB family)